MAWHAPVFIISVSLVLSYFLVLIVSVLIVIEAVLVILYPFWKYFICSRNSLFVLEILYPF